MKRAALTPVLVHASCISIEGRGVLIMGRSGSGKSDLALRLIDRGATLVSDDCTLISRAGERLLANAPETIAGKIEIRGVGIVTLRTAADIPLCLAADLDRPVERIPEPDAQATIAGAGLPVVAISPLEASAPIKLEMALRQFGLNMP